MGEDTFTFIIDGTEVKAKEGQTIMEAADVAGIYIPRLCAHKDLVPFGSCRVCTVKVNGSFQSACTYPAIEGAIVENNSEEIMEIRRDIIRLLFVEGNHYCMFCEKSGNCELQALAYRFGITDPKFDYMFPDRELDGTNDGFIIEHNRCVLCGRCVRASRDLDKKHLFDFVNRGKDKRIAVDSEAFKDGRFYQEGDRSIFVCPVGCLIKREIGYSIPIGERLYDHDPIGSDIENKNID